MLTIKSILRSTDSALTAKQCKQLVEVVLPDNAPQLTDRCIEHNIQGVDSGSKYYPSLFHRIHPQPPVIYRQGDISLLNTPLLACVGPRMPAIYVREVTEQMCEHLSAYHLASISGGAEGVDMLVHTTCLAYQVPTIVVLGAGFRRYINRPEWQFFERVVAAGGLILSERKIDQPPAVYTFPQRNRLIAGSAQALFVPGAALGSGTCITIDFALQFGIPVWTVPGPIHEITCQGTNALLCARKIAGTSDMDTFLKTYFIAKTLDLKKEETYCIEESDRLLLTLIRQYPDSDITLLCTVSGVSSAELLVQLLHLEMAGLISSPQPGHYIAK